MLYVEEGKAYSVKTQAFDKIELLPTYLGTYILLLLGECETHVRKQDAALVGIGNFVKRSCAHQS